MPRTIVITRARGDEIDLTEALHERGHHVIHEPVTEIILDHTQRAALEEALLREPDAVIVTSRHGVRALATLCDVRDTPLLCVGDATTEAAQNLGFSRVSSCGGQVESLLAYILGAYDAGSRFLYVSAEDIRAPLDKLLTHEHMPTQRLIAYAASAMPQLSDTLIAQLAREQIDGVAFLSRRSAEIFVDLAHKAMQGGALEQMEAFCLSPAIADTLRTKHWRAIHAAKQPTLASVVDCIDNVWRSDQKDHA
jgi:uroporphyrinogen-III synthase